MISQSYSLPPLIVPLNLPCGLISTSPHTCCKYTQIHAKKCPLYNTCIHSRFGIVFYVVDNLIKLYSFPSLLSPGYLTYICSTTLHLNLPSPPIYPTLHFYTIYLLPILYLLHPSTTIGTPNYIVTTPFLFSFIFPYSNGTVSE